MASLGPSSSTELFLPTTYGGGGRMSFATMAKTLKGVYAYCGQDFDRDFDDEAALAGMPLRELLTKLSQLFFGRVLEHTARSGTPIPQDLRDQLAELIADMYRRVHTICHQGGNVEEREQAIEALQAALGAAKVV